MKLQTLIVVLSLFLTSESILAQQGCPEMYLETQSQVDSFPINYPGCNRILGTLSINSEDVYNLDSLYSIRVIEGDLEVGGFNNFHGLHNVDSIYGSLDLRPGYGAVTSFDSLRYIGGSLSLSYSNVPNIPGFPCLSTIDGNLEIYANQFLSDISGLSNLNLIKGELDISLNYELSTLAGLENLESDSLDQLYIYGNPSLTVCNMPFICAILSNPTIPINIYQNAPECNNPSIIATNCGVTLPCLPFGNYYVTTQEEAENFGSLYPGCDTINGLLSIKGDNITSLPGLIGIVRIDGYFSSGPTQNLINFSGLDSLKVITGGMQIGWWEGSYNSALQNFSGLDNLTSVGRVEIINNQSLQNFEGLGNLRKMGMTEIIYNDILTSLNGLNKLDTVNELLSIGGNPMLTDLSGLKSLRRITGRLEINHNDQLTSLYGLDSAKMDYVSVGNNPLLSECDVKSVCDFLATPGSWAYIEQNTTGCNSREEVEEACQVGINDISGFENMLIYPNPADDFFRINIFENELNYQITVLNSSGQTLIEKQIHTDDQWVNVSKLQKGIYLVKLVLSDGNVLYSKLVK